MSIICGVPEHFNFPLKEALKKHPQHRWEDCTGGSGQMRQKLNDGEVDYAVMLTEAAVYAILQGDDLDIVTEYVSTPLFWGIYCHSNFPTNSTTDSSLPLLVSRYGSGSHLIPFAKAHQEVYSYNPEIKVISNLDGALQHFNKGNDGLFYWEEVTTEPFIENNSITKVGLFPAPWPSFVLVKRKSTSDKLNGILGDAKLEVEKLKLNAGASIETICNAYNLDNAETKKWLNRTEWFQGTLNQDILITIAEILKTQSLIESIDKEKLILG